MPSPIGREIKNGRALIEVLCNRRLKIDEAQYINKILYKVINMGCVGCIDIVLRRVWALSKFKQHPYYYIVSIWREAQKKVGHLPIEDTETANRLRDLVRGILNEEETDSK